VQEHDRVGGVDVDEGVLHRRVERQAAVARRAHADDLAVEHVVVAAGDGGAVGVELRELGRAAAAAEERAADLLAARPGAVEGERERRAEIDRHDADRLRVVAEHADRGVEGRVVIDGGVEGRGFVVTAAGGERDGDEHERGVTDHAAHLTTRRRRARATAITDRSDRSW
jgi:hypothetical protein